MAISKIVIGVVGATAAGAVAIGVIASSGGSESSTAVATTSTSTTIGPRSGSNGDASTTTTIASGGRMLADPSCQQESSRKSIDGNTTFDLTFVNNTAETVQTLWLSYEGKRTFYRKVPPGTSYVQPTFITHPWVVADLGGRCLTLYVTDGRQQTVTVPAGSTSPPPQAAGANAGPALGNATVIVKTDDSNRFVPNAVDVPAGGIVEWDNAGTYEHNVTFDDASAARSNDLHLTVGAKWQVRFPKAGTFTYVCTIHPDMTGAVNVR